MIFKDKTDRELYRLVARGNDTAQAAFAELASRYESMVYNIAHGVLGNSDDAFDAAQEALLRVWLHADRYRGDSEVKTWIYRIAKNAALDALRARSARRAVALDDIADTADVADAANAGNTVDDVEEEVERRETIRAVRAAIEQLAPERREVIVMRELYGMEYGEIADALSVPVGTVKSRLSRARDDLYELLREKIAPGSDDMGTNRASGASNKRIGKESVKGGG